MPTYGRRHGDAAIREGGSHDRRNSAGNRSRQLFGAVCKRPARGPRLGIAEAVDNLVRTEADERRTIAAYAPTLRRPRRNPISQTELSFSEIRVAIAAGLICNARTSRGFRQLSCPSMVPGIIAGRRVSQHMTSLLQPPLCKAEPGTGGLGTAAAGERRWHLPCEK
jgi:hypothetical protein